MHFVDGLQIVLGMAFLLEGGQKVISLARSVKLRDQLRIVPWLWILVGALEMLGAAGLFVGLAVHPLAGLAGIGLACVLAGAIFIFLLRRKHLENFIQPALALALIIAIVVARLG